MQTTDSLRQAEIYTLETGPALSTGKTSTGTLFWKNVANKMYLLTIYV